MSHCLTKSELAEILARATASEGRIYEQISAWYDMADAWEEEIVGLNYFVAQIAMSTKNHGGDHDGIIAKHFHLDEEMWFTQEDFGFEYVDYLMRHTRDTSLSLEDELVQLRDRLGEYGYEHTLRF